MNHFEDASLLFWLQSVDRLTSQYIQTKNNTLVLKIKIMKKFERFMPEERARAVRIPVIA